MSPDGHKPGKQRWSRERIIDELREMHASGGDLSTTAMMAEHPKLFDAARSYLGSWKMALEEAGIDPGITKKRRSSRYGRPWSKEYVIEVLTNLDSQGVPITYAELNKRHRALLNACYTFFGSFEDALAAANVGLDQRPNHWTDEQVLIELRSLSDRGVPMNRHIVYQMNDSLVNATATHFRTFENAVNAAGLEFVPTYGKRGHPREKRKKR